MRCMWIFMLLILRTVEGWSCESTVGKVFSRKNTDAVLQFDLSGYINQQTSTTLFVKYHNGTTLALANYNKGDITYNKLPGVDIVADISGNVWLIKENVERANAGVYYIISPSTPTRCNCLYILGTPIQPSVSVINNPPVGGSTLLSCTSTSTTTPSNHSLGLIYSWRVDNIDNPSGPRYTYSTNKNTLTLSNIVKEDANKQFTCTATEDVTGGYTSSPSDSMSLNILYGPENVHFSPKTTISEKAQNTSLDPVTCTANCNPACSFQWRKVGNSTVVSNSAVLDLGILSSSETGTYRCTATRSGGSVASKDLTVNVIYGPQGIFVSPSNTTFRYNENVNPSPITCGSSCWVCQYRWTGPNTYTSSGAVLDLGSLTRTMHGQYICTASNTKYSPQRQKQKAVKIEVRYGPDSVSVSPPQLSYTVDEGSTLANIKCSADCFPACTYRWMKEGQNEVLSDTDTLSLGKTNKSNFGNYTCRATNRDVTAWSKNIRVSIIVQYGPYASSTVLSPSAQEYTLNEGATNLPDIRCSADCYPACRYTWTKHRNGETTTVQTVNGILSLGSLSRMDGGNYTCVVTHLAMSASSATTKSLLVHIRYGPDTSEISVKSPYTVTEGKGPKYIRCSSDCYPGCSYSWINVTSGLEISSDAVLSFGTVTRYMAGIYKCTVSNTAASEYRKAAENSTTVIVGYAPDVSVAISPFNTTEGANVTVFCIGHGVPSEYHHTGLIQTVNGIRIPNSNKKLIGTQQYSSIHFPSLRLEDTGIYRCKLNNNITSLAGVLDQTGSINVTVKVLPKILADELRFAGAAGGSVHIELPIYSFPELDTVSVTRFDGAIITQGDRYNLSTANTAIKTTFYGLSVTLNGTVLKMTIRNLVVDDFENYSITLTNRLGSTAFRVFIIAKGPLSEPYNITIGSVRHESVSLSWIRGYHGGASQSFVVEVSTDRNKWREMRTVFGGLDESEVPISAELTGLRESTLYFLRMYAFNKEGHSSYTAYVNFTTLTKAHVSSQHSSLIGGVAGGVSAVVLIALVVVVVLRHRNKCTKRTILTTLRNYVGKNKMIDSSKLEMSPGDNSRDMYEQLQQGTDRQERNVYDSLEVHSQRSLKDNTVYENLKQLRVDASPLHSTLPAAASRNDTNPTYENLKL